MIPKEQHLSTTPQITEIVTPSAVKQRQLIGRANIVFAVAIFLLLAVSYKLLKELEIIYVSALFAVVLMPVINKISELRIRIYRPSRAVAIVILLVGSLVVLALFFTIGLTPVINDLGGFSQDLPKMIPQLTAKLSHLPFANKIGLPLITAKAESFAGAAGAYIVGELPKWLSHLFDLLTAMFLCIYFMLEGEHAYAFFLSLFTPEDRPRLDATLKRAELKMSKWLLGQGLLMLSLGTCSLIVFGFMHVRYFILLGVLMGLLNIIPIAGGVITILLVAIVAALDSWAKMAGVFAFYAIYVNVENAVLTPRIMKSSVDLMGLTVLVALLIGTALAGIVGALVAVPTAALIAVLLEEYAVKKPAVEPLDAPVHAA